MVKRLLLAIEYPQGASIDLNNEDSFRKLVVWLEENKLKKASPNVASALKNISSSTWKDTFAEYRKVLGCPDLPSKQEEVQWLLGYCVQIETENRKDVYLKHAVENLKTSNVPSVIAENPLDQLNFRSKEFSDEITNIANILKITPNPDPLVTLEAVRKLVTVKLSPEVLENPNEFIIKGTPFPFQDADLGFDLKDPVLNKAAKVLRMLYIQNLRDLQTKANELIVGVQNVTANPKTDTKLGKVGV